jgi:N-acetyltransferase 10
MVRKRLDERVRTLIERGVVKGERSILVLVGDHGKDQVPNLHQILSKTTIGTRPSVLWCYKKELGFSTHRKKRIKKLKRDKARGLSTSSSIDTADNFELFISSTDINWCYYKDSHRVLGTTVGMLVLQDFEALTPNLMARTIETVQGGGLVIFLMRTVKSLKQLYTMTMDVHARYRTESAGDVVPRFNERFILSLANCSNCLVCDDELNVLPISKRTLLSLAPGQVEKGDAGEVILRETTEQSELNDLKESLIETPHVGVLVDLAKTLDQAKALLVFLEACSEKTNATSTVAMTAARGRGKSAAVGLCLAGAVSLGYSTIAVTAPEPENLVSVFDFLCRGLKALKYQEHLDYTLSYNSAAGREAIKCIVAINIHRSHRQVIQYIAPHETDKFSSAEIVAIDEAAAIPLPVVRALMHQPDRLTFLSSTVNGYEGTGRALSLKLIKELREAKGGRQAELNIANTAAGAISGPRSKKGEAKVHDQRYKAAAEAAAGGTGEILTGPLREIELSMPIRYAEGDGVESWLNKLLCLDSGKASQLKLNGGAPAPLDCELYSVDRDALFSYHKLSEAFLQKLMGLYTSAHYKNTPNDLQMLSDAPAHSLFVLLSPSAEKDAESLPDILAVVQVALEGKISRKAVEAQLARGHRSAGDLIPWTISQQFGDSKFAQLSGARIVRIAVHPSVQSMGYGSRAVELLYRYYNGEMISLDNPGEEESDDDASSRGGENETDEESLPENNGKSPNKTGIQAEKLAPRKELPPLLLPLTEVDAPRLDWIGTSFGLTLGLHKFWSRVGMQMLYLRQTKNELTGEHSAILIRALPKTSGVDDKWLDAFVSDTRRRFLSLLSGHFRDMPIRLAISVLEKMSEIKDIGSDRAGNDSGRVKAEELAYLMTPHDMKRLELYGRNLCDHHLVTDLLPTVSRLYFTGRFGDEFKLSSVQAVILCGIGVQHHDVDAITKELGLPSNQVLAMFNKAVRKMSIALNIIVENKEKESLLSGEQRLKAEKAVRKMGDVAAKTLEEDAAEAATDVIQQMTMDHQEEKSLPPEIANDASLMQYAIKGTDEQWGKVLEGKEIGETGTVSIRSVREKRKALDAEDFEKEAKVDRKSNSNSSSKKGKKKKSRR